MDMMEKWKKFGLEDKKRWKSRGVILLLLGVLLLVIAIPVKDEPDSLERTGGGQTADSMDVREYLTYTEKELEGILSQMEGAGAVEVMITLEGTSEKVVEKDRERQTDSQTETDSQGGSRVTSQNSQSESTIYNGKGGGGFSDAGGEGQSPYVTKEVAPKVEGVVVAADGGGDAVVRKNITECVQALFGIDTHKIRIVKRIEK